MKHLRDCKGSGTPSLKAGLYSLPATLKLISGIMIVGTGLDCGLLLDPMKAGSEVAIFERWHRGRIEANCAHELAQLNWRFRTEDERWHFPVWIVVRAHTPSPQYGVISSN